MCRRATGVSAKQRQVRRGSRWTGARQPRDRRCRGRFIQTGGDRSCSSGLWGPESPHTCHLRHPGHSLDPTLSSSPTAHTPPLFPPDSRYLTPLVCIGFTALTPPCILIAKQNPPVVKILKFGWFPIILAMLVSRCVGGDALRSGWGEPWPRAPPPRSSLLISPKNPGPGVLCGAALFTGDEHQPQPRSPGLTATAL